MSEATRQIGGPENAEPLRAPLTAAIGRILAGTGLGLALIHPAQAQTERTAPGAKPSQQLEEIVVTEARRQHQRIERSALPKLTENLRDTPQSITTLSRELLDERGAESLNDALRNVPGITLGAGEFSWQGNNPSIRGFNARDDMYLDGIRDFGSYPRDPFNLEAVEVLLGPSSVLFGRGSTGGAINQVSKHPTLDALTNLSVNVGSDHTVRSTLDLGRPLVVLGDGAAFRFNVLAHRGKVADRDGAETERFGLAPSLALGIGSATQLTLSYLAQTSDDRPDYGLPWLDGAPAPVSRASFYGFEDDYLKTDAGIFTAELAHVFSDSMHLDAQVRYADYTRNSRITEPLITQATTPATPLDQISVYRYVFLGDSEETMLTGQAAVTIDLATAAAEHTLVAGLELSRETSAPQFAFASGVPGTSLLDPTPDEPFSATSTDPRIRADTKGGTLAAYALDTLKLGVRWQATLGARLDRFDTDYDAVRFAGPPTPFNAGDVSGPESFDQVDTVVSYRAALVYKPVESRSLYIAGSTSFNPSAQSLSLLTSGRGLGTGNALLDPEKNRSFEVGLKADLRDGAISLTSALFAIAKTNARVPDPNNPGFNTLGGEERVRGVSLDLTGALTDRLYLASGYTYLDSEVVKGAAGAATGARLANAPRHSLSVWADYGLSPRFDFGIGARYVSEQLAQNTGAGKAVPAYTLLDAMGRFRLSDSMTVKMNLTNLTDEYYFDQLHPWHVVPGPGRTATLAVNVIY
jgi:catecholate siderophore receptor